MRIVLDVLARGVAVPGLDHRARERAVLVHDAQPQADELPERALAP